MIKEIKGMKNKTNGKVYYSFDELGQEVFNLKPYKRVTKDKQKLAAQREKFQGTCPYCKEPLHYIYGTNVVVCNNENCKGKKIIVKNGDGTEFTDHKPYLRILQGNNSSAIGATIFED